MDRPLLKRVSVGGLYAYVDYAITYEKTILALSFFESSVNLVKGVGANLTFRAQIEMPDEPHYNRYYSMTDDGYKVAYLPIKNGRDRFVSAMAVCKGIGSKFLITDAAHLENNLYNHLMTYYPFPILKEWMPYLRNCLMKERLLQKSRQCLAGCVNLDRQVKLNDQMVKLSDIETYSCQYITEEDLERIISDGLKSKMIRICEEDVKPLRFENFDEYISMYGKTLVENLEKTITPLMPLKGKVDEIALRNKTLFPQQAACINGINALQKSGSKYGLMIEGMGVGKTLQAASTIEAYFNEKWLRKHPGKSLKDCYLSKEVSYRVIIMAPGHLVEKWKEEVEKEIPNAKGIVLSDFNQLVELRREGKERRGKIFYVVSKDFAKLGSTYSPIPSAVGVKMAKVKYCADCYSKRSIRVYKGQQDTKCSSCGGHNWLDEEIGKEKGLKCPFCGELLTKYSSKATKDEEDCERVLTPKHFASQNAVNSTCYHCDRQLWGVDSKNINCMGPDAYLNKLAEHKSKWYKLSHFTSYTRKTRTSAFVLRDHEYDYLNTKNLSLSNEDVKISARESGNRKTAPSLFIKKYLKGYFDFLVLDEVHKFEGQGSAQSTAAHALMKASKFTLGLTGTVSNGTAASLFSLLFMLDPKRMIEHGYTWSDSMEFSKKYGSVETVYQRVENRRYNSSSRGRVVQPPKVKPGISPLLFVDFLMDKAVFLDLSDLSRYLPPLHEYVKLVDTEEQVGWEYRRVCEALKTSLRTPEGCKSMSAILTFGLSYADKPYDRLPIMSASMKDVVLATPNNFDEYKEELLNKEKELINIVNSEMDENRNVFIYCSYTGDGETNVTYRLQEIIEKHCNLEGRVQILQSTSPNPLKREKWIQKKASEGIKVFISNPKCVETGLDFCFNYEGKEYNFPTLVFYQMNYELATIWQASRRAYRLNQTKECRTYYLAYSHTLQQAAVEIMAQKITASSAIQGKFSVDGLAAMATGVDARVKMAQALSNSDSYSDRKSLENMFDVMNANNNEQDDGYEGYTKPLTYYQLIGKTTDDELEIPEISFDSPLDISLYDLQTMKEDKKEDKKENKAEVKTDLSFDFGFGILNLLSEYDIQMEEKEITQSADVIEITNTKPAAKSAKKSVKKSAKKSVDIGQMSLFDIMAI